MLFKTFEESYFFTHLRSQNILEVLPFMTFEKSCFLSHLKSCAFKAFEKLCLLKHLRSCAFENLLFFFRTICAFEKLYF